MIHLAPQSGPTVASFGTRRGCGDSDMTIQREEEKTLLERLEGRWVRGDGQEMAELGPDGVLRWSKA